MEAKIHVSPQKLSPIATVQLMQSLLCYQGYVSAGSTTCQQARDKFDLPNVGRGDDTMAQMNEKFAHVCTTCPVLLTALSNVSRSNIL